MKTTPALATTLALSLLAAPASAATYTLDILTELGGLVQPRAINDNGQVTGRYASNGFFSPFLYDPDEGVVAIRDVTGENVSEGVDINNNGVVAGVSFDRSESFQWSQDGGHTRVVDTYEFFNGPGEIFTRLYAINNNGTAVVQTSVANRGNPTSRIEVFQDGQRIDRTFDLSAFGDFNRLVSITPTDINDQGQVLGLVQSRDTGLTSGIWDEDGSFTPLEVPDGFLSVTGSSMNNLGQVAGVARRLNAAGRFEGLPYFWDPLTGASVFSEDLLTNPDGSIFTPMIGGINDFGQFVGSIAYDLPDGTRRTTGGLWNSDGSFLELENIALTNEFDKDLVWLFDAVDINNKGQITGRMSTRSPAQFFTGAYVLTPEEAPGGLTPVPLPAAGWALLTALMGLMALKRRRRVA